MRGLNVDFTFGVGSVSLYMLLHGGTKGDELYGKNGPGAISRRECEELLLLAKHVRAMANWRALKSDKSGQMLPI